MHLGQAIPEFVWGLSQMTWNGSMRPSACLDTPFCAPKLDPAFAKAEPAAKAVLVETIKTKTTFVAVVQSCRTAPYKLPS